jgi:HPt (histidine-containing phosphotransfer) domain-containing protein
MQNPSSVSVLNPQTLERLSRLDPNGRNKLLERVLAAFETSSEQMLPAWNAACENGDVSSLHYLAHTLKSSSASIGALSLSALCAKLEAGLREHGTELKGQISSFNSSALGVLSQELHAEWQSVLTAIPRYQADWVRSQA